MRKSIPGTHSSLSVIGSAVSAALLVACGGGTGETPPDVTPLASRHDLAVKVVDGPIFNALVCLDLNENGACDSDEPQGRSDAGGMVVISIATEDVGRFPVLAEVGTDAVDSDHGPVSHAYRMAAPADWTGLISPLTSMILAHSLATGSTSADAAVAVQAHTGVADALADYTLATAPAGTASLARSVAASIAAALQAQAAALHNAAGQGDASGVMMSAADISQASLSAVHRLLPAIAESASAALPADGQAPSAGASALREQQMHALIAAAGLSANGVGHAVAASRSTASSAASSPEPSARLDQFRFGDAENWSFRAFLSNAAENTPADHGTTRFRELRRSRQGTTLLSWAGNSDSNRRDEHWTGSRWAACDTGTQGINSARDAASRTISNYCDHRQITANRASNLVITGKTFQEVFDMIRATPGQGLGFADVPAGFSGVRDTHLGARTWPAGASLRYQASTPLAHAPTFDVRDNNRVLAYPAEITAGGDARSGTAPACASVTSTNGTRLLAVADTLESLLQRMGGAPCRFNPGTLSNADGSRVNSGEANDWWSNSTLSLGRVGSAPVGASPYATYYTSNKLLRVAFGPDGRADYFSCRERASDGSTRNCVAAGSGRYAIRQLGDVRLMSLSGQPAGLGYERVLVERAGAVYYGYQNKPLAYETRRLNLTALNALFEAVGLPALVP